LVADPVAGARVAQPEARRDRLEVPVVVVALRADLDELMIDVADGDPRADPVDVHRLEVEPDRDAGAVVDQALVDRDRHLVARLERAVGSVRGEDLLNEGPGGHRVVAPRKRVMSSETSVSVSRRRTRSIARCVASRPSAGST